MERSGLAAGTSMAAAWQWGGVGVWCAWWAAWCGRGAVWTVAAMHLHLHLDLDLVLHLHLVPASAPDTCTCTYTYTCTCIQGCHRGRYTEN